MLPTIDIKILQQRIDSLEQELSSFLEAHPITLATDIQLDYITTTRKLIIQLNESLTKAIADHRYSNLYEDSVPSEFFDDHSDDHVLEQSPADVSYKPYSKRKNIF